jgi:hypothetical protein
MRIPSVEPARLIRAVAKEAARDLKLQIKRLVSSPVTMEKLEGSVTSARARSPSTPHRLHEPRRHSTRRHQTA